MDQAQVPFQIAAKLDWPVVPAIVEFTLQEDGKTVVVARDTDKGREKIQVSLPAVFSTTKGLNDPRYAKLKGIMAAKKKPLDELTTTALGLPEVTSVVVNVSLPPARKAPVKVEGEFPTNVIKLVDLLRNEAKVI
jgi:electron transfer flavoprotein beta subunit